MGMFSFLNGKSPEKIELAGDQFYNNKEFGAAKIEYEKALTKIDSKFPEKTNLKDRLYQKIRGAKEALAQSHMENSRDLIAGALYNEAADLLHLALELTEKDERRKEISDSIEQVQQYLVSPISEVSRKFYSGTEPFPAPEEMGDADMHFSVLCNALPEAVMQAYKSYNASFRQGYIALNNGDFQTAVEKFNAAINQAAPAQTLIPLELATAWVHLGAAETARDILDAFVAENPHDSRAYQMLCDIYWEMGQYGKALRLIEQCPPAVQDTFPIQMLLGETCFQMKQYTEAAAVFAACEKKFGENEMLTRAMAKTYEARGELEKARAVYARILKGCTRCGVRTDPFILRRYADLCFACGERDTRLLEMYLSLLQEDPDNKNDYYQKIYELYQARGNTSEALRYQALLK